MVERAPAVVGRASARRDFEAKVAYVLEEGCVCVLLVVMLVGVLFTGAGLVLIAREFLGIAVDRIYPLADNLARGKPFSVPVSADGEHGG